VGDLCGNGRADVLVAEIGVADYKTRAYLGRPPHGPEMWNIHVYERAR